MKTYSFERVFGAENAEQVVIHRKNHGFRLGTKLLCLLFAFLFWLIMVNVKQASPEEIDSNAPQSCEISATIC